MRVLPFFFWTWTELAYIHGVQQCWSTFSPTWRPFLLGELALFLATFPSFRLVVLFNLLLVFHLLLISDLTLISYVANLDL